MCYIKYCFLFFGAKFIVQYMLFQGAGSAPPSQGDKTYSVGIIPF
jgi:hypothetical protein